MTTKEFKIKCPHLSHLEGNDLWNAMEDAYIHEHKDDKPEDVTDWKGNVIKEGDEVCFIKIKSGGIFKNMTWLIPNGDGSFSSRTIEDEPEEDCWAVGEYVLIEKGLVYTSTIGDYTFTMPISGLTFCIQPGTILAIKGVSDMKE